MNGHTGRVYMTSSNFRQRQEVVGSCPCLTDSVPGLTDSSSKEKGNDRPKGKILRGIKVKKVYVTWSTCLLSSAARGTTYSPSSAVLFLAISY